MRNGDVPEPKAAEPAELMPPKDGFRGFLPLSVVDVAVLAPNVKGAAAKWAKMYYI